MATLLKIMRNPDHSPFAKQILRRQQVGKSPLSRPLKQQLRVSGSEQQSTVRQSFNARISVEKGEKLTIPLFPLGSAANFGLKALAWRRHEAPVTHGSRCAQVVAFDLQVHSIVTEVGES